MSSPTAADLDSSTLPAPQHQTMPMPLEQPPRLTHSPQAMQLDTSGSSATPAVVQMQDDAVRQLQTMSLQDTDEPQTDDKMLEILRPRPHTPRQLSDSLVSSLQPGYHHPPPRNRSPYSRSVQRPHTSSGTVTAPPMTRAHSSPTFTSPQFMFPPSTRSQSPLRSPKRVRSPFRPGLDESYPGTSSSLPASDIESISEDHELYITPRPVAPIRLQPSPILSSAQYGNTFPRMRRRPASPLHQVSSVLSTPANGLPASAASASTSSPLFSTSRFNEAFPSDLPYSRSFSSSSASVHSVSVPSTPTSTRSRSPSISSLETIPDSPDAEEAAIKAERLERLKRVADGSTDNLRRGSFDSDRGRSVGFGGRDKRKRWSVCGAEKRSDLNLETIWED